MSKSKMPTLLPEKNDFHLRRRQQFLYKALYANVRVSQNDSISIVISGAKKSISGTENYVGYRGSVFREKFWLWMLEYTAGADIDELALQLPDIVTAFEQWEEANIPFRLALKKEFLEHHKIYGGETHLDVSVVDFDNQIEYQTLLQFVSVAILLRDARSVKRIVRAMRFNRHVDGLYEELILDYVADPHPGIEEVLDVEPYGFLRDAYSEQDDARALECVQTYLKRWYRAQNGARWYDAHRKIEDDRAFYYGYWAFEAGATCYLLDIDDSGIDHMVYPKDLVAYARRLREEKRWNSPLDAPLDDAAEPVAAATVPERVQGGGACPQAGWWHTPAASGRRRYFQAGETMPVIEGSDYGSTYWQWDADQTAPKL